MGKHASPEERARAVELVREYGMSEACRRTGRPYGTLLGWARLAGVETSVRRGSRGRELRDRRRAEAARDRERRRAEAARERERALELDPKPKRSEPRSLPMPSHLRAYLDSKGYHG